MTKLVLLAVERGKSPWLEAACSEYQKKLQGLVPFELVSTRSQKIDRENKDRKVKADSQTLLKRLEPSDLVILWDERGREMTSVEFSARLQRQIENHQARVVLVLGGPYGFDKTLRERAAESWSLSKLTLAHPVAQIVALEQIYRALTIWKHLPYHNE